MSQQPPSPVDWQADGRPYSPQYGDVYRSQGLAQAQQIFLGGCGLLPQDGTPAAWAGQRVWAVLENGFGLGLNFLATWHAWLHDAQAPARLLYTATEAHLPSAADLLRSAAPYPELLPLAHALAAQWQGLLPGVHRLPFAQGRLQLTLAIGPVPAVLAEVSGLHDSLYLDGFAPARNPAMWGLPTLKALSRLLRRGARAATWCVAAQVRADMAQCGFEVQRVPGLPPKRHALQARYAPHWPVRQRPEVHALTPHVAAPGRCLIVGSGLAGASAAYALAQRGWQVSVLDAGAAPAAGASGLPAGVVAPHVSQDDRPLSRLSRAGAAATLQRASLLLQEGVDWAPTGVLERHSPGDRRLPPAWASAPPAMHPGTFDAANPHTHARAAQAGLSLQAQGAFSQALWHQHAGWLRPAALVRAMLAQPGIDWRGRCTVAALRLAGTQWQALDAQGQRLAEADLALLCAGFHTLPLLPESATLPLHALRGQVAWGPMPADRAGLPLFPVNGHGSFISALPPQPDTPWPGQSWWISGSTFERGNARPDVQPADHAHNRQRLATLLPAASQALHAQWEEPAQTAAWAAVRATLPDRLPAVGALPWPDGSSALPPHTLCGLGARGLTLAVLCGELIAASLHHEPLPIASSLLRQLRAARWQKTIRA